MKYLFFITGLVLFVAGVGLAVDGVKHEFDASAAVGPVIVGALLIAFSVGIHIYDNWAAKQ